MQVNKLSVLVPVYNSEATINNASKLRVFIFILLLRLDFG